MVKRLSPLTQFLASRFTIYLFAIGYVTLTLNVIWDHQAASKSNAFHLKVYKAISSKLNWDIDSAQMYKNVFDSAKGKVDKIKLGF